MLVHGRKLMVWDHEFMRNLEVEETIVLKGGEL